MQLTEYRPDLERRRLAIVRALQGHAHDADADAHRLTRVERDISNLRRQVSELASRLDARMTVPVPDAYPVDDHDVTAPPVPSVGRGEPMSDSAAKALFGY